MTKHIILCSLLLSSFAIFSDETFTPVRFTWNYNVQPCDVSNMDEIKPIIAKMRVLLNEYASSESTRSNGTELFQKFLIFVKEVQEAIFAGCNLFGSATTHVEPLLQVAQEVAEEFATEASAQAAVIEENATADDSMKNAELTTTATNAVPGVTISISCTANDFSELESWNNAKVMLQDLTQAINDKTMSPEQVVNSLVNIYNTLITVKEARLNLTATDYNESEQA